ncbi:MAG: hypothetical protein JSS31_10470 [Proteobacteria bacterium]|nr:hypothetical protein [Pseudomonadota bacterium]MBS0494356.1 hypothetical protein [Pseudomonadota bacterium]
MSVSWAWMVEKSGGSCTATLTTIVFTLGQGNDAQLATRLTGVWAARHWQALTPIKIDILGGH